MAQLGLVMAVGAILGAAGQYQQGRIARRQGEAIQRSKQFEAEQLVQSAGQEQAAAQRKALEERRRASLVASRALALSAASGAGASDPTVEQIISEIDGEGEYRAAVALYGGEERARRLRMGADAAIWEGENAAALGRARGRAATVSAIGSLAASGGGMYAKYGMGGPTTNPSAGTFDSYELFSGKGMTDPRFG